MLETVRKVFEFSFAPVGLPIDGCALLKLSMHKPLVDTCTRSPADHSGTRPRSRRRRPVLPRSHLREPQLEIPGVFPWHFQFTCHFPYVLEHFQNHSPEPLSTRYDSVYKGIRVFSCRFPAGVRRQLGLSAVVLETELRNGRHPGSRQQPLHPQRATARLKSPPSLWRAIGP